MLRRPSRNRCMAGEVHCGVMRRGGEAAPPRAALPFPKPTCVHPQGILRKLCVERRSARASVRVLGHRTATNGAIEDAHDCRCGDGGGVPGGEHRRGVRSRRRFLHSDRRILCSGGIRECGWILSPTPTPENEDEEDGEGHNKQEDEGQPRKGHGPVRDPRSSGGGKDDVPDVYGGTRPRGHGGGGVGGGGGGGPPPPAPA